MRVQTVLNRYYLSRYLTHQSILRWSDLRRWLASVSLAIPKMKVLNVLLTLESQIFFEF